MVEPTLRVGLALRRTAAELTLNGDFEIDGAVVQAQRLQASLQDGRVRLLDASGQLVVEAESILLSPRAEATFVLHAMTVGVDFHWQHEQDLTFSGTASLESRGDTFDVVNGVPLETYLRSVISSEMSATAPGSLLRAHAVISRSWLLAQLADSLPSPKPPGAIPIDGGTRVVRWYDREDHQHFDVCADDHCQRYQGVTRTSTHEAVEAVADTHGLVLMHDGSVCDARYSKACGGMTEVFEAAWGPVDVPYLQAFADGPDTPWQLPLTDESNAISFIQGAPPAYCNTTDRALLERLLPALDHDTTAFYRWETTVTAAQVREWVRTKIGVDPGPVRTIQCLERGPSGRLTRIAIVGDAGRVEVGKELEIRRVLSDSHLYSSAFVVTPRHDGPELSFHLRGAGWGHGVGLCQIGAAVMADLGHDHQAILAHYFRGAELVRAYG
ncbi:MAG: SpoIID/LytB domain-containing protein [Myxococcales bacterium]|nr:SpoIID/LytB domain-containing protein [Myxococcales bacterium]